MPHFIIECSEDVLKKTDPEALVNHIFNTAVYTEIFKPENIKVRIAPYQYYSVGGTKADFIHIQAFIMSGRTTKQKKKLSKMLVKKLMEEYPQISSITTNIIDMEKECYTNKNSLAVSS